MNILSVQCYPWDPPGPYLELAAARHGGYFSHCQTFRGDAVPTQADHIDGLVMLGGSMGAYDEAEYPFLLDIVDLIRSCHEQRKPAFGICLGAQLIARAFGGKNYPAPEGEIGFFAIERTAEADRDPLLKEAPRVPHLVEFHFDTFDLPPNATLLMTGSPCRNQAFRIDGSMIYGFQPHLECSPDMMNNWLTTGNYEHVQQRAPEMYRRALAQLDQCEIANKPFCLHVADRWMAATARRKREG